MSHCDNGRQPSICTYNKFTARTLLFVISSSLHNQADLEKFSYDLLSKIKQYNYTSLQINKLDCYLQLASIMYY